MSFVRNLFLEFYLRVFLVGLECVVVWLFIVKEAPPFCRVYRCDAQI